MEYHTGLLANRFVVRTPRKVYHCWAARNTESSTLDQAAAYIRDRLSETPEAVERDDGAERLTYRGQPISPENHPGVSTGEDDVSPSERADDESASTGDGTSTADRGAEAGDAATADEDASNEGGTDDQQLFTYRGQTVTPEQHPGISTNGAESSATGEASDSGSEDRSLSAVDTDDTPASAGAENGAGSATNGRGPTANGRKSAANGETADDERDGETADDERDSKTVETADDESTPSTETDSDPEPDDESDDRRHSAR